jgi:hypothetical protein
VIQEISIRIIIVMDEGFAVGMDIAKEHQDD